MKDFFNKEKNSLERMAEKIEKGLSAKIEAESNTGKRKILVQGSPAAIALVISTIEKEIMEQANISASDWNKLKDDMSKIDDLIAKTNKAFKD